MSFCVLDEILNLIESVSEDFPSYSLKLGLTFVVSQFKQTCEDSQKMAKKDTRPSSKSNPLSDKEKIGFCSLHQKNKCSNRANHMVVYK